MSRVSVIIPTYNRANLICEAVNSVLAQTYQDYEIIIVDDGSTDDTGKVAEALIVQHPNKISYLCQNNHGAPSARNIGIRASKGEFIAFLDSDDLWFTQKLEKCVRFIEQSGYDWVTTAATREEGLKREERIIPADFLEQNGQRLVLLKNGLYFFSSALIVPSGVLMRKECFAKAGMFDESLKVGEDTDMWLRFEEAGLVAGYIAEPFFTYRVHGGSMTKIKTCTSLENHIHLARKHALILGVRKPLIRISYAEFLWRCSDLFFSYGCYWKSLYCYLKSWWIYPSLTKLGKTLKLISRRLTQRRNQT